jgi:radical SAM superfamily enzyme YgiQ (UPF0313 family)
MKKTDVVLVYPPSVFEETSVGEGKLRHYQIANQKLGTWPPLGLLYLAACLEAEGIKCEIFNPFVKPLSLTEAIQKIGEMSPRIVGISATTLQMRGAVQLAEGIKKKFGKQILIGVGGPHISIDPNFVREFNCFDFGLIGEAEITFPRIVRKILRGKKIPKLTRCELPINLDALPFPDRKKIKISDYFSSENPTATLITSRGCPFNCVFCSRVGISDRVRFRSPKLVVDEIEEIKDQYKSNFTFLDDTFTLNRKHILDLCQEIINRKIKISWSCNTRANLLDEELVEKMREAGCRLILVGVESGDEKMRNEIINKKVTDRDIYQAIKICKQRGVLIGGYFMLGFPGETKKHLLKTAQYPRKYNFDIMSIHATTIYPGSALFELAQRETGQDFLKLWYQFAREEKKLEELPLVYVSKKTTFADIEKARRIAYLGFYFRPSFLIKQILRDLRSPKDLKRDILQGIILLRFGKTSKDLK